eukprot:g2137.t1
MSSPASKQRQPGAGQPYFVDQKKGEVNELRMLLGKITVQRDKRKMREVVKKVIAYMTLGIDVTRVFDQMVMACHTTDLVIKKMVYLYLTHYAAANPELAILGINTLCKDSRDADPMVRGLAIRSLTSLRLPSVVEYVMEPIRKGLMDNSSYVRKAAVMGILKVYHLSPGLIQDSDFVNQLYNMVRDADAKVVTNCLVVLNEIMQEEGGVAINKKLITYLLNRINDFDEWGQTIVLDLVPKYTPRTDEEAFAFMNVLDGCLRTPNSGVALATVKAFLHFTENLDPGIRRQACMRIKSPLMTMMAGACPETSWVVCKHVEMIVRKEPGIFDDQYKSFYCRHNDPSNIQFTKLEILPLIANPSNMGEICAELTEYTTDISSEISRKAIRAVGRIGMRVPSGADSVMNQLLGFLDLDVEHVTDETMVVVKNLLRKYPDRGADVAVVVKRCMKQARSPEGRAAVIWIYGEFGSIIPEAPYALETIINNVERERPPEMQAMLGRLMAFFLDSEDLDPDLNDRAMFYYRLLKNDPERCKTVVTPTRDPVDTFTEDKFDEIKEVIMRQFNTLAVLYGLPASKFTDEKYLILEQDEGDNENEGDVEGMAGGDSSASGVPAAAGNDDMLGFGEGEGNVAGSAAQQVQETASAAGGDDLLGDLLGFGNDNTGGGSSSELQLVAGNTITQAAFQQSWMNPQATANQQVFTAQVSAGLDLPALEGRLRASNVMTLASGAPGGNIKAYLYGQTAAGAVYLCELIVSQAGNAQGTCKSATGQAGDASLVAFANVVEGCLPVGASTSSSGGNDLLGLF